MTGSQLKAFRESYGFLQLEFAKRLGGIHPITLSRWESEAKTIPAPLLDLAIEELKRRFAAEGLKPTTDGTKKKPARPKKPKLKK